MKKANTLMKQNQKLFLIYLIGTIVIIFSMFFILKQTAMGKEQKKIEELFAAVDVEEQIYIDQVREELSRHGFYNCGITMTKTATTEGAINYQVLINHRNLKDVELNKKEELINTLKELPNTLEEKILDEESVMYIEFVYEII